MAIPRVDDVRYRVDQHPPRLTVWLFNDDSFYAGAALKRVTRYDFDRRFNPDGTSPDRKEKLDVGIYRTPFRDGWRYTISSDVHGPLCETIIRYATYGWKMDENGERVPFTYLRHNRKALEIFDLIKRYLIRRECCLLRNFGAKHGSFDYHTPSPDFYRMPYFEPLHNRLKRFEAELERVRAAYIPHEVGEGADKVYMTNIQGKAFGISFEKPGKARKNSGKRSKER